MATKRYKRSPLPSKLHKELQRAALIVGLDVVYKGSRTNEKERRQRLYNLFHGDPNDSNNVSLVDHGCIKEESGWLLRVLESRLLLLVVVVARFVWFALPKWAKMESCHGLVPFLYTSIRYESGPRFHIFEENMNPVPFFQVT
jgi:hypothetical protein